MNGKLSLEDVVALKRRLGEGKPRQWDGGVACTVVDCETGRIKWTVSPVFTQIADQSRPGDGTFVVYGDHDEATTWFPAGWPEPRPLYWAGALTRRLAADGAAMLSIPVPKGSLVTYEWPNADPAMKADRWRRTLFPEADETIEFATTVPGEYRIELTAPWPFQQQVMTIIAEAIA